MLSVKPVSKNPELASTGKHSTREFSTFSATLFSFLFHQERFDDTVEFLVVFHMDVVFPFRPQLKSKNTI